MSIFLLTLSTPTSHLDGQKLIESKILSTCAYRLWFHPLTRYPGPFWGRLTNVYAAYHSWKGDLHIDMWRCHEKYGTILVYQE